MDVHEADAWWRGLPEDRRLQIFRWINQPDGPPVIAGQLDIFEDEGVG